MAPCLLRRGGGIDGVRGEPDTDRVSRAEFEPRTVAPTMDRRLGFHFAATRAEEHLLFSTCYLAVHRVVPRSPHLPGATVQDFKKPRRASRYSPL